MKYASEVVRDSFHKSNAMLQVIINIIEQYFNAIGFQGALMECEQRQGYTYARLDCSELIGRNEELTEVARRINEQFKRKDGMPTCQLTLKSALFEVCLTNPGDLEKVH